MNKNRGLLVLFCVLLSLGSSVWGKSELRKGEFLTPGKKLVSPNGFHALYMQTDGNLVLYSFGKPEWDSDTAGNKVKYAAMQPDGNLVIYTPEHRAIWASGTSGHGPSTFYVQSDRNLVIYRDKDEHATWSSKSQLGASSFKNVTFQSNPKLISKCINDDKSPCPWVGYAPANVVPAVANFAGESDYRAAVSRSLGDYLAGGPGATKGAVIVCTSPPAPVLTCVGVMVAVAIVIELAYADPPFGPSNDLRVIGGKISREAKKVGRDFQKWRRHAGGAISKTWKDIWRF